MDKYMHAEDSDLLSEAIPESLKNMLLVMDTAGVFQAAGEELENSSTGYTQLWTVTWDRIDSFLPRLKEEVFKPPPRPPTPPILPPAVTSEDAVLESNCSVDQAIRTTQEEDSYELVSVTVEEPGFVERRPSSVSIGSEGSSITLGPSQAGLASSVAFPDIPAGPVAAPVAPVPPSHSVILHPPSLSPPPVLPTAVPQIATPVPLVIDPIVFCEQHHSVFTPSQNEDFDGQEKGLSHMAI
ncbi:hypothetical protein HPB52_001800 [Rhipicephalus sanguineus]|uniref:GBF1-like tetratricopeptide repeats domain-containing protein n=1 Tax=Rhipicephalus sanguineus TaxID=34632 RepID=A0A9D4T6I9_RHISA|nr:hypothetical protein HPB52_001800 [Rhipicephalus sanguineus]